MRSIVWYRSESSFDPATEISSDALTQRLLACEVLMPSTTLSNFVSFLVANTNPNVEQDLVRHSRSGFRSFLAAGSPAHVGAFGMPALATLSGMEFSKIMCAGFECLAAIRSQAVRVLLVKRNTLVKSWRFVVLLLALKPSTS